MFGESDGLSRRGDGDGNELLEQIAFLQSGPGERSRGVQRAQSKERGRAWISARQDRGEDGYEITKTGGDGEWMRRVLSEVQKHGGAETPSKNFDATSLDAPRLAVVHGVVNALLRAYSPRGGTVENIDEAKNASSDEGGGVGIFVAETSMIGE